MFVCFSVFAGVHMPVCEWAALEHSRIFKQKVKNMKAKEIDFTPTVTMESKSEPIIIIITILLCAACRMVYLDTSH